MSSNISALPPLGGVQNHPNVQANQGHTMPMSSHDMSTMADKLALLAKLGQKGLSEQQKLDTSITEKAKERNKAIDNQNQ